ncbi:MAG: (Fe-S)-binding protein, partial [Cyanobacteria bacterium REEB65]|nr:(Fe-S)-binding protein [Cyanobacteria bacterium REEB65]
FLTGCAMPVLFPQVNAATVRLLTSAGFHVIAPPKALCCGALQAHDGDALGAGRAAGQTRAALAEMDRIVTNSAGCGAAMKEYSDHSFASKVRDLSEALLEADWQPDKPLTGFSRVVYHDPCHLSHGQGIRFAPRELLRRAGLALVEMAEADLCCGGAGSYTLLQPGLSQALLDRKVRNLLAGDPDLLVTANPSCLLQLRAGLRQVDREIPVRHLAEVLADTLSG